MGVNNNSFLATDGATNTAACNFDLTVNDGQPPTVTCVADVTVGAAIGASTAVASFGAVTSGDNCPGSTLTPPTPVSGDSFPIGTTPMAYSVADSAGNTAVCSFDVIVSDYDECAAPADNNCNANAACTNTDGSFTCACDTGFTGDGVTCTEICGDGLLVGTEACDDGGLPIPGPVSGDGCNSTCTAIEFGFACPTPGATCFSTCGDAETASDEACDDGDNDLLDGCDAACAIETGWTCPVDGAGQAVCSADCGDGLVVAAEECDDVGTLLVNGIAISGDGCSAACQREFGYQCTGGDGVTATVCAPVCGDGERHPSEPCDDAGTGINDGCDATCNIEFGYTCVGDNPSSCTSACGDGLKAFDEGCDDADVDAADGCSDVCAVEFGWYCPGNAPSVCNTVCGDALKANIEACDDGDLDVEDGCDAACGVEAGFTCIGGSPTNCSATCGANFNFAANDGGFVSNGLFSHGSGTWTATGFGPADPIDTWISRPVNVPTATLSVPEPLLNLRYIINGDADDCLRVYLNATGDPADGGMVFEDCVAEPVVKDEPIDLSANAGPAFLVVRFVRSAGVQDNSFGASVLRAFINSDIDADNNFEQVYPAAGLAGVCDPCYDQDLDGYGRDGSPGACPNAGVDCDDDTATGVGVDPDQIELCTGGIDDNCDTNIDLDDPDCQEDCANGIDDGGNSIADCADAFCVNDPFCAPCKTDWTFDSGAGLWTPADGLFSYVAGPAIFTDGGWKTGGATGLVGDVQHTGRLQLALPIPDVGTGGPTPRLEITYKLEGEPSPAFDVFAICLNDNACTGQTVGNAFVTGVNTAPGAPPLGGPPNFNDGEFDHVFVDVTAFAGTTLDVTLLFDTITASNNDGLPGLTISGVRLASDTDVDGIFEGTDAACDPCWDVDADGYGDALSPDPSQCTVSAVADCADDNFDINPGASEICGAPEDEDCDGNINAFDSDCGAEDCADGLDNNGDGNVDCADPTCAADAFCAACDTTWDFASGDGGWASTGGAAFAATRWVVTGAGTLEAPAPAPPAGAPAASVVVRWENAAGDIQICVDALGAPDCTPVTPAAGNGSLAIAYQTGVIQIVGTDIEVVSVSVVSDIDTDGLGEADDVACDHCVDADSDDYGDASVAATFITDCANPGLDCDDLDNATHPDQAEDCAAAGDQNCDAISDFDEALCLVCGDGTIQAGEECDDGGTVSLDGCSGVCAVETEVIRLTEIHLATVSGAPAEQWFEIHNTSPATINLSAMGLTWANGAGVSQTVADCTLHGGKGGIIGSDEYFVIALGPIGGADGLAADAACDGSFQLTQAGDSLAVTSGSGTDMDTVGFDSFACHLANDEPDQGGRSFELADPATLAADNDAASAWCLAEIAAPYANSGKHFGSPGGPGTCAEFACDGIDDDCDGTTDDGMLDTDIDGVCDLIDCNPGVDTCSDDCVTDVDLDTIADCADTCLDTDGDGYGVPGGAGDTCLVGTDCDDDNPDAHPTASEGAACLDGADNDCDGLPDCTDPECSGAAECSGESCAAPVDVACGALSVVDPASNSFPCGAGADTVLRFSPTVSETISIEIGNEGDQQYSVSVSANACTDLACAGTSADISSTCVAGGSGDLAVTAGNDYFLVVDQVSSCAGIGTSEGTVRVVCGEVCDSGDDEDGDGTTDCADTDCVASPLCT
ncbi:MAG: cysteine-rich repeat protein, partial [Myxococcota bacterium]